MSEDVHGRDMATCSENNCENEAAVRVYIPWDRDQEVCPAHARAIVQQDGVIADPLPGHGENWP
jgi:hypothetical protein